jgi:hypothetical protein
MIDMYQCRRPLVSQRRSTSTGAVCLAALSRGKQACMARMHKHTGFYLLHKSD